MNNGTMSYGYKGTDFYYISFVCMNYSIILNIGSFSNNDGIVNTSDSGIVPNISFFLDGNVSVDDCTFCNEGCRIYLWFYRNSSAL